MTNTPIEEQRELSLEAACPPFDDFRQESGRRVYALVRVWYRAGWNAAVEAVRRELLVEVEGE